MKLSWIVFLEDFNKRQIVQYDIFTHSSFCKDLKEEYQKNKNDKQVFAERLKRILRYYFWSKCEYEIILSGWPPRDDFKAEKIDAYDQVMLNFDVFLDYIWNKLSK